MLLPNDDSAIGAFDRLVSSHAPVVAVTATGMGPTGDGA